MTFCNLLFLFVVLLYFLIHIVFIYLLFANWWKYIYRFFFFVSPLINFLHNLIATESWEVKKGKIISIIHGTWSFLYRIWKYRITEGNKAESVVNMLDWDLETWILFLLCPTWPWANPFLCAFVQHRDSHIFSPFMLCFFQLWGLDSWR